MSAVKNLRAMFEQKGETSPPERGRSPGIPLGSESPRPLSKVRTSFIAIEKEGRIGLQRERSQDSITGFRKLSGDSNVTTPITGNEKPNPFEILRGSPAKMNLQTQPIPESPRPVPEEKDTGSPVKEAEDAKQGTAPVSGTPSPTPGTKGTVAKEVSAGGADKQDSASIVSGRGGGEEEEKTAAKEPTKPATIKPRARTAKPAPKPLSAPSEKLPSLKPEKSPTLHRAPKTPTTPSGQKPGAKKTPGKKAQPAEKPATPRKPAAVASESAAPSSSDKLPVLRPSPASTGSVKPKPKSPTRPVKLPAGLTTHTASSGSKISAPRQSFSRASDFHPHPGARPASRTSASTATSTPPQNKPTSTAAPASASTAVKNLKRQGSIINQNRPARPSLGPPPKKPEKDHTPTRKEKEVDEGFLARMMRPTQASASKVADKVQLHRQHVSPSAASKAAEKVQQRQQQQHRSPSRETASPAAGVTAAAAAAAAAAPASEAEASDASAEVAETGRKRGGGEGGGRGAVAEELKKTVAAEESKKTAAVGESKNTAAVEESKPTASVESKTAASEEPKKTAAPEEPKKTAAPEEPKTAMPEELKSAALEEFVKLNVEPKAGACVRRSSGSMSVQQRSESSEATVAAELARDEEEEEASDKFSEPATAIAPSPPLEEEVIEPGPAAQPEPTAAVDALAAVKVDDIAEEAESKNELFTTPQENVIPETAAKS